MNGIVTSNSNKTHLKYSPYNIFKQSGTNIKTLRQLRTAIYVNFFDNP